MIAACAMIVLVAAVMGSVPQFADDLVKDDCLNPDGNQPAAGGCNEGPDYGEFTLQICEYIDDEWTCINVDSVSASPAGAPTPVESPTPANVASAAIYSVRSLVLLLLVLLLIVARQLLTNWCIDMNVTDRLDTDGDFFFSQQLQSQIPAPFEKSNVKPPPPGKLTTKRDTYLKRNTTEVRRRLGKRGGKRGGKGGGKRDRAGRKKRSTTTQPPYVSSSMGEKCDQVMLWFCICATVCNVFNYNSVKYVFKTVLLALWSGLRAIGSCCGTILACKCNLFSGKKRSDDVPIAFV